MALPFMLLSLMAPGTMPVPDPAGQSFLIVLCAGHAPVRMVLDAQGNVVPLDELPAREKDASGARSGLPCAWAAAHGQPLFLARGAAQAAVIVPPPRPMQTGAAPAAAPRLALAPRPMARGPPPAG
ncbi:MAG: hypothetical protein QM682_03925 [Paracoccus sp. (in: a-proteobacteria)]|uniref:hypothetical protein n=1 Tax=Paracoccus sp. TaxID=267 RepID=UPI0039E5D8E7